VLAVSPLDIVQQFEDGTTRESKMAPGDRAWVPAGVTHSVRNEQPQAARFVTVEFTPKTN
jgi:mannose-6-phosphate isomerase-like protein (cupin superfamily)